jgi:hypothetical protein
VNPTGTVFCDECGTRLIPHASEPEEEGIEEEGYEEREPVKGLSLPTIPLEEDAPEEEEDWVSQLRATMPEGEEQKEEEGEEEVPAREEGGKPVELPDWLKEGVLFGEDAEAAPVSPTEPPLEEAEAPDWLEEIRAETRFPELSPEEAEVPEPVEKPEVEAPDRLRETPSASFDEAAERVEEPEDAPPSTEPPLKEAGVLKWLPEAEAEPAEEGADEEPEEEEVPAFVSEEGLPPVEPGEIPEWLTQLRPEEEEEEAAPAPARPDTLLEPESLDLEGLAPAEIPEWLEELRPGPGPDEAALERGVETEGMLKGLRGTLPASPVVAATGRVGVGAVAATSAASVARAELFQELLGRPPVPARRKERREARPARRAIERIVVGVLLLAAIIAPMAGIHLYTGEGSPAGSGLSYDAIEVYEVIESQIGPDTPTLVAFEYGISEAEEMDRVAGPMIRHLLGRGGRLIVVSTDPEGPALAERLISELTTAEQAVQVVNLGYQPGGTTGVRELLANLAGRSEYRSGIAARDLAAMEGVTSAQDVALMVVLAGKSTDLRAWVEQTTAGYADLPVVAGISARVEPSSRPYVEGTTQLRGIVTGLAGAASYETRLGPGIGLASFYLRSLTLGHLAVAGLMVLGAAIFFLGGKSL